MAIDPGAVGARSRPVPHRWTSTDALLYALGVGAGAVDPLDELALTTENSAGIDQQVLPTMAVVIGGGSGDVLQHVGSYDPAMAVHGEQSITLHRPLPVAGEVDVTSEITAVHDKGSGAVIEVTSTAVEPGAAAPLFTRTSSAFIRGEGGFGGDRGPSSAASNPPDREPDHRVTYRTRTDQALLYRLSGDRNPLHSDPSFAAAGGFERPILHGLCTYGFTGRALLHAVCGSDPARFAAMAGRFSSPVMPGEELRVDIWVIDEGTALFRTHGSDGRPVISAGRLTCA